MTTRDYNTLPGEPRVRIGNWVEERSLLHTTGFNRTTGNERGGNTAARIIPNDSQDLPVKDWSSTTRSTYRHGEPTPEELAYRAAALPSRQGLKKELYMEIATEMYQQQQASEAKRKAAEIQHETFGHRAPYSRSNLPANADPVAASVRNPLNGAPLTIHLEHKLQATAALSSTSPSASASSSLSDTAELLQNGALQTKAFAKSTAFSKPIEEYTDAPCR